MRPRKSESKICEKKLKSFKGAREQLTSHNDL